MMPMMHPGAGGGAAPNNTDLVLRSNCVRCGAQASARCELFAASCRHMTLCIACGRAMAEASTPCTDCGTPVKTLIKEFKVKKHVPGSKQHFLGRFAQGLPAFSVKNGLSWSMRKDIPRPADPAREKFKITPEKLKSKPWILEDDTGAHQFQGQLEGGQQAIYYILMKHGRDFHAIPAGSWYNFHKLVQYKQLTLEEAEEQMKNRRKTADGYQRWMMKAAPAAFAEAERGGPGGTGGAGGNNRRDSEGDESKRRAAKAEEDEDLAKPEDFDPEDEYDRGDDWEHEETFTDDDEAVGNDAEEREELPADIPAPPEIKQEEDEMEAEEGQAQEGGGLSQSGRDMKKLLGKAGGFEEEEEPEEDEEDEDLDLDNEDLSSPVLAPTRKDGGGETGDTSPAKSAAARPSGSSAAAKGKRKAGSDEAKASGSASKKSKAAETKKEVNPSKKDAGKSKQPPAPASTTAPSSAGAGCVTEEEVKAVIRQSGQIKSQELVGKFKSRLKTPQEKTAFAAVLKRISRIQKRDGSSFIVLKEDL